MASLFGVFKKIFGGNEKPAANETVQDAASGQEAGGNIVNDAIASGQEALNTAKEQASSAVETAVENVTETVSETVDHMAEAAVAKVSEVANSDIVQEAESVAIAAAGAVGGVSGAMTEAVTGMAQAAAGALHDDGEGGLAPTLPPLALKETIDYLDRDHFVIPRSDNVIKAIALIDETVGEKATAKAMRIFEYGVAAGHAYELRVDRELLLLGALLGQLGDGASAKAEAFCVENGMWDGLAKKVAFAIENASNGLSVDDIEVRALALGVAAEAAKGEVDYVHAATAAETRNKHIQ